RRPRSPPPSPPARAAWGWASSSPAPCWSGPARRFRSARARHPRASRAAPSSPCAGRVRRWKSPPRRWMAAEPDVAVASLALDPASLTHDLRPQENFMSELETQIAALNDKSLLLLDDDQALRT